jgi:hypothetical protein
MKITSVRQIDDKVESKIKSAQGRTANNTADQLRIKLSIAELNLEKCTHLMGTEWTPLIIDFKAELLEATRLSHRLDLLSSRRVQEILNGLLERLSHIDERVRHLHEDSQGSNS